MIPYGRHEVTEEDVEAVISVLRSDFLTQGSVVPDFEQKVADVVCSRYAVAVNSATSALHIACLALSLGPGDILWTSPITFVASANCARYCGAEIDFVDIDPATFNMSVKALAEKLEKAKAAGRLPKIVVPVHMGGQSCDMEVIYNLSQEYGFRIIEDASHAIGGQYKKTPVGSCKYSDICVFSFHPVKIITTAEGGVAVTNDKKLADAMALLRSHGITRDVGEMTNPPDGAWYYQQIKLGLNYRLNEIQAALGRSQLARLEQYISKRRELAYYYNRRLANLPLSAQLQHADAASSWHLYVVRLHLDRIKFTRKQVFDDLRACGIGVQVHYIPVHLQPYYNQLGFRRGDFLVSEEYYAEAISLPLYATLTRAEQDLIAGHLETILAK